MKMILLFLISLFLIAPSCKDKATSPATDSGHQNNVQMVEAFPNLQSERPVDFQNAGDDSKRVFVVEQRGIISVFENKKDVKAKSVFLDITKKVDDSDNEEGLLGLAFHPDYAVNGYFYLNYTVSSSETVISRFKVSAADPNKADPDSELILLRFNQPYGNHNGGQVAFGPDGYLYISTGDGGSGGDPKGNGQNLKAYLGKILRIDVNNPGIGKNYGIPADNPFISNSNAIPEIYAYGMRNPWRMSFDTETGKLWCGDVGQNAFEEIDIIEKGGNYGWNDMEGLHTYKSGKNSPDYKAPVLELPQSGGDKSITGGHVYRGTKIPTLKGKYIFADYVSGRIYAITEDTEGKFSNELLLDQDQNIAAFGVDEKNEIYICAFDGKIYTLALE